MSPSLGTYVHLPFCRVRCTYCPFAISTDQSLEGEYFAALSQEIESGAKGELLETLYVGGGTPSHSSPDSLRGLIGELQQRFEWAPGLEFTLEANPEDVDLPFVELVEELGVNRVSLGVQSLSEAELRPIGRAHGAELARRALALLSGRSLRLSADLMIGLPTQTTLSFDATVEELLGFGVRHVSLYMLDLEEGTKLEEQVRNGRIELPDDGEVADWYLRVIERLERAGLQQYEISNFAIPGEESRHNLRYWNRLPYRGYGAGAHRFDGAVRSANSRDVGEYIELIRQLGDATTFREELTAAEQEHELIFLSLRQRRGISYAELARLRGEEAGTWIDSGLREGWLRVSGDGVAFTPKGFVLSNEYISRLF